MRYKIYKIYKLTNLITNMSYVGWTYRKFIKRIIEHTKADSRIGNALRKHEVKNFKAEVLHEVINKNLALLLEIMEIWNNNCIAPNGYNLTLGGDNPPDHTGEHHTEETIEKMKEAALGNKNGIGERSKEFCETLIGNKNAEGCKHSEEWKQNKREEAKGNQYAKGKHWKWSKESKENAKGKKNAKRKNLGEKNGSYKHGKYTKEAKIERLKTKIKKLEVND